MKIKRFIKKTLIYTLLAIFIIVTAGVVSSILYKDEIINHFINEANKHINTPVKVDKIRLSAFDNFPQITLTFENIYVQEITPLSSAPLLKANSIDFTFNSWSVLKGHYTIKEIHIYDGEINLRIDKNGVSNYNIINRTDSLSKKSLELALSKLIVINSKFTYKNQQKGIEIAVFSENTLAKVYLNNNIYNIDANGKYYLNEISSQGKRILVDKELTLETKLKYDDFGKSISIRPSTIRLNNSDFLIYGDYSFANTPWIELYAEGKETTIQNLTDILPSSFSEKVVQYRSSGDVYFDLVLKGTYSPKHSPLLGINFGLLNAELIHPDSKTKITDATAEGYFRAQDYSKINSSTLELNNIKGRMNNRHFSGNFSYKNFDDPYVKLDFSGELDIKSLFDFYATEVIQNASGLLFVNVEMEGKINDLKQRSSALNVKTSGDIELRNVSVKLSELRLPLKELNGNLLFNKNDLALSNVTGYLGNSDFLLNGFFKNIIAFLLFDDEPVGIESDMKSDFIDLDELLQVKNNMSTTDYSFEISPRLLLNFNCDVKSLNFRRFKPTDISGGIKIKEQKIYTDKLEFSGLGGKTDLTGFVNAVNPEVISVHTTFNLHQLNIDSIFYVFENFNQTFLEDKHLKGKIEAEVDATFDLKRSLRLYPESLVANIGTTIIGGELNNFEPMQRLSKYLDEDKLDHLVFSELKNDIHIENETIYLPQMEVKTNVTDIRISGTHTFDKRIDYRVVAPLRSERKIDRDEAFGAIEEVSAGRSMIYLKITGRTSDYKIIYDQEGVKKKIISDLKKEIDELKRAFKNKGLKKERTIELNEDDYFDWDDNQN